MIYMIKTEEDKYVLTGLSAGLSKTRSYETPNEAIQRFLDRYNAIKSDFSYLLFEEVTMYPERALLTQYNGSVLETTIGNRELDFEIIRQYASINTLQTMYPEYVI